MKHEHDSQRRRTRKKEAFVSGILATCFAGVEQEPGKWRERGPSGGAAFQWHHSVAVPACLSLSTQQSMPRYKTSAVPSDALKWPKAQHRLGLGKPSNGRRNRRKTPMHAIGKCRFQVVSLRTDGPTFGFVSRSCPRRCNTRRRASFGRCKTRSVGSNQGIPALLEMRNPFHLSI